jgi:uncharacterized membrane protein YphA (DoxX/SURF4 family)
MNINPKFVVFVRVLLGIIFIAASLDKIIDPASFARDIANYHVVPFGLENVIAIFLPWLELFIGLGLIFGFMVDGASIISGVLLVLFILIILQATLRGFNIECGCGLKEGELIGWRKIFEDIIFLLGAYIVYKRKSRLYELDV